MGDAKPVLLPLKVGDTVWRFDGNYHIYTKAEPGQKWSGSRIIYRECFRPDTVTGETSRSFLVGPKWASRKLPKRITLEKRIRLYGIYISVAEVDAARWLNEHHQRIVRAVEYCRDGEAIRKVAALVGYKEDDRG